MTTEREILGFRLIEADCLDWLKSQADNSVDLVIGSPPYEGQREYDELAFNLIGDEWIAWALGRYIECVRVCRGLVSWVIEGTTDDFTYSATPMLLMSELIRSGVKLRKPAVYYRHGIPGTGGPDFWRNDWEMVVCASKGRLPWSQPTACGTRPKYHSPRTATNRHKDGTRRHAIYRDPDTVNPGNVIRCHVGKGHLGWEDAHANEAPFPESLVEPFVKCFCPPGGIVLDPFCGSGTTLAVAQRYDRKGIGIDMRASQLWLTETRLMGLTAEQRRNGQRSLFDVRQTETV